MVSVSQRERIWFIGLVGGALVANYFFGPSAIPFGGIGGLILLELLRRSRVIDGEHNRIR